MTTITKSTTLGVDLNPATYTSPVAVDAGVTISNPDYPYAIYRHSGATAFFVIENYGTVSSTSRVGIYLAPGGSVTNAASASITGGAYAVKITDGAGTVLNDGSIAATSTSGVGVGLISAGSVTNAAFASITGGNDGVSISGTGAVINDGAITGNVGVRIGGTGTVVNSGTIVGVEKYGVVLGSGGSVTNATSALIRGADYGIEIEGGPGTVINSGSITSSPIDSEGIDLESGGSVTNEASGSIAGGGIDLSGPATVANYGTMATRIEVFAGGLVTNAASASITGNIYINGTVGTVINDGSVGGGIRMYFGGTVSNATSASVMGDVDIFGTKATLLNDGSIQDVSGTTGNGAYLGGGSIINAVSGSITGGRYGVDLYAGGTLTNAGTIRGDGGTAVEFGGTSNNLLVLEPGFKFFGVVAGSATASNTLELASAASIGTVAGLGSEYIHFQSIVFDAGAEWSISGVQRGLAGTISGFTAGDTIVMTGVTATGSSYVGGILALDESGGGSVTLDLPGPFTLGSFDVTPGVAGGTEVTIACFRSDTRILTASGEVPVEQLRVGDQVVTQLGCRLARIVWLGHRCIDCTRHQHPDDVWPIRIKAGAIADGIPHRDLWLSPEHAVLLRTETASVLVPIRHLLNGTTIVQVPVPSVTYWHVELASHDAIVAEGLPAETYLDTGNRSDFSNGGRAVTVHPTFADGVWRARACAPQLRHGNALAALRHRLASRAPKPAAGAATPASPAYPAAS